MDASQRPYAAHPVTSRGAEASSTKVKAWPSRAERRESKELAIQRLIRAAQVAAHRAFRAESRATELEARCLELQCGSSSSATDDDIIQAEAQDRLSVIGPSIYDKVSEGASGNFISRPHSQRLRRNVAEHAVMGSGHRVSKLCQSELRLAQRNKLGPPSVRSVSAQLDFDNTNHGSTDTNSSKVPSSGEVLAIDFGDPGNASDSFICSGFTAAATDQLANIFQSVLDSKFQVHAFPSALASPSGSGMRCKGRCIFD